MIGKEIIKECVRCGNLQVDGKWYFPKLAPPRKGASYTSGICNHCMKAKKENEEKEWNGKIDRLAHSLGVKLTRTKSN